MEARHDGQGSRTFAKITLESLKSIAVDPRMACKRSRPDPLTQKFLQAGWTLLKMPNNGIELGDVYVENPVWTWAGELGDLLALPVNLPNSRPATVANIEGVFTQKMEAQAGFGALSPFLAKLGLSGSKMAASASAQSATKVSLALSQCATNILPIGGLNLTGNTWKSANAALAGKDECYVITGIMKASELTIRTYQQNGQSANAALAIKNVVDASVNAQAKVENAYEIVVKGAPMVLAVKTQRLCFDAATRTFTFSTPNPKVNMMMVITEPFSAGAPLQEVRAEAPVADLLPSPTDDVMIELGQAPERRRKD